MSGLFVRSHMNAGQDGFRDKSSKQMTTIGIAPKHRLGQRRKTRKTLALLEQVRFGGLSFDCLGQTWQPICLNFETAKTPPVSMVATRPGAIGRMLPSWEILVLLTSMP